jgi:hypothetical protein
MVRRSGLGAVVAAAAVGCSLITPLDYVGGSPAGSGGRDGTGGTGGAVGGVGNEGGNPEGGTGEGATGGVTMGGASGASGSTNGGFGGSAADGGTGGDAGEGGLGESGSGGSGNAGGGGVSGGGVGGDSAGTAGGGGCAGADLGSDPMHCGACGTVCGAADYCIDGACVSSPCDGLCSDIVNVESGTDGYRMDNIGTAERCFEVVGFQRTMNAAVLICWNFASGRTLEVNGNATPCMTEPGTTLGGERAGGYCVKAGAGQFDYAGFKFRFP